MSGTIQPQPAWTDWLSQKLGTRMWVVQAVLTPRLRNKGYTVALSQKRYAALMAEYENEFGSEFRETLRGIHRELGEWADRRILVEGATVADLRRALAVLIIKSESNPNAFSLSIEEATRLHNAEKGN